ncbi:MAG TPA: response regulator [Terriglobia bacterium]|nr:response regulator [Terriglobia bacterium]
MNETISALLVHDRADHLFPVKQILRTQQIKIIETKTCQDAAIEIAKADPPHLVFTDTSLPDGSCLDIIRLARQAAQPVNVIVASRIADLHLYIEAMEHGAFDFISGSCLISDLAYILHQAAENVIQLRTGTERLCPESPDTPALGKTVSWDRSA